MQAKKIVLLCICWLAFLVSAISASAEYVASLTAEKTECYVGGVREDPVNHRIRLTGTGTWVGAEPPKSERAYFVIEIKKYPQAGQTPTIVYVPSVACMCDNSCPQPYPCIEPLGGTIQAEFWSGQAEGVCEIVAHIWPCAPEDGEATSNTITINQKLPIMWAIDEQPKLPVYQRNSYYEPIYQDFWLPCYGRAPNAADRHYEPAISYFRIFFSTFEGRKILHHFAVSWKYWPPQEFSDYPGGKPPDELFELREPETTSADCQTIAQCPAYFGPGGSLRTPDRYKIIDFRDWHWAGPGGWLQVTVTDLDSYEDVTATYGHLLRSKASSPWYPLRKWGIYPLLERVSTSGRLMFPFGPIYQLRSVTFPVTIVRRKMVIEYDGQLVPAKRFESLAGPDGGSDSSSWYYLTVPLGCANQALAETGLEVSYFGWMYYYNVDEEGHCLNTYSRLQPRPCGVTNPYWREIIPGNLQEVFFADACRQGTGSWYQHILGNWYTDDPATLGDVHVFRSDICSIWCGNICDGSTDYQDYYEQLRHVVTHELGHALGLGHCLGRCADGKDCVMVEEIIDMSAWHFCSECKLHIRYFTKGGW